MTMERHTAQRQTIRDVFDRHARPLSPAEVLREAKRRLPRTGIATVYRAVKGLVDEGWLIPVELPGEPPRYERAGLEHHHHFHCRKCGKAFDVNGCDKAVDNLAPPGYKIERHEIVLYGLCKACAAKA